MQQETKVHCKVKNKGVFQGIMKTLIWFTLTYCATGLQVLPELGSSIKIQNTPILLNQLKVYSKGTSQGLTRIILEHLLAEQVYSQQFPWLRVTLGHCFSLLLAVKLKMPISYIAGTPSSAPTSANAVNWLKRMWPPVETQMAPEAGGAAELVHMRLNTTAVLQMPDLSLGF